MNFTLINTALLYSDDFSPVIKNQQFYKYLLDNNVAYYYSQTIPKQKNSYEKDIIASGEILNDKYIQTLKVLYDFCKKEKVDFLLFKTYKHLPEIVDGDIDLFIKEKDFSRFLTGLKKEGFTCILERPRKASCSKAGYSIIEPRVTISFHGKLIVNEENIWKNTKEVVIKNIKLKSTTKEIDTIFMLLNMFYGPNYIKLYNYIIFKSLNLKNLYSLIKNGEIKKDLDVSIQTLSSYDLLNKRFPIFPSDITFVKWWSKKILLNPHVPIFIKIKHLLFFYYAKYGYILLSRLPFAHNWKLTYV